MNRILQYDQIDLTPTKITQRDDPLFGPVTVFHDVPIARTIVQQYEDGFAYKPANELEDAAWTALDRWIVIGHHPETAIVSNRNDIGGRTTNIRFTKSLINAKTNRPEDRGILADLEIFNDKIPPDVLAAMKSGIKRDVSIGFFFDQDTTPGIIGDDYPQLKGTKYDYVQRNIMIDHTAAALETGSGRCAFPECGIGADQFKSLVTGDPVGPYKTFGLCVVAIMKKNPSYTREQAEGTCGEIEKQTKEKDFISTEENNTNMSNALEDIRAELQIILDKIPMLEQATDDLVEEEYQGNAENITESMRARAFFTIGDKEWDALSEEEKLDYISRLPPKKVRAGGEELSDRDSTDEDCEDCDEEDTEHKHCPEGETWSEEQGKCVSTDDDIDQEEEDPEQESDEDEEIELLSTDESLKKTAKVLADIERLVG